MLAAGEGARFGGGKLLAPWNGGVLLDGALASAFAAPVRRVSVVWGADASVAEAAESFALKSGDQARLTLVYSPYHAQGLSRSLAAGIASLAADCLGAFVFLGDMPRAPVALSSRMAMTLAAGAVAVAPIFEGRRGHPVLFDQSLFAALQNLTGDRGAGDLLNSLGDRLALIESPDDGVLYDVDRPEDLT